MVVLQSPEFFSPRTGCVGDDLLAGASRAITSLGDALSTLTERAPSCLSDGEAIDRGHFRPEEERQLFAWFARLLTVRNTLWEVLEETARPLEGETSRIIDTYSWRCFVLAYSAACLIVRLDRFLVEETATHTITQRKLNEGNEDHRIPRKQFTVIFESFTDPQKALLIYEAMRFAKRNRTIINAMSDDVIIGSQVKALRERETALDPSRRKYWSRLIRFISHAWRRRGASGRQKTLSTALELGGRIASELHDQWTPPYVGENFRQQICDLLRPGDVLVTRHEWAVTNLFLPGYWPHTALFVGYEADRKRLGIEVDALRRKHWSGDRCVLEALKDGVLYRPIEKTLAVDAVAVIRPTLGEKHIAEALARVSEHEGKGYNFDFDFFRSDRLVCTEVVYRAYDGIGSVSIPLNERAGRPTLSAEDLLDLALEGRYFRPIAICGAANCAHRLATGDEAEQLIAETLRSE